MRIVCLSLFFSGDDTVVFLHSVDVGYVLMIDTFFWVTMSTPRNGFSKHQRAEKVCGQGGPNWILIAGGALLSTLSIRFGYKLKQSPLFKPPHHSNASPGFKGTCFKSLCGCFFTYVLCLDGSLLCSQWNIWEAKMLLFALLHHVFLCKE